jgi:pyruvate formate lyase activating enzyme
MKKLPEYRATRLKRMNLACKKEQRKTPLLFEIKGNSLDDGPGIRSVIFFKGCPLDCVWCHNPESKSSYAEISYDPKKCIGCGTCLKTCTVKALSKTNPYYIDRTLCTLCYECVDECPSGALERVGFEMSVDEIIQKILADKPFFDNSRGGVTLSGGEPTLHMEYASEIASRLKALDIHIVLETSGLFNYDLFSTMLLPHLDMIYYDIKIFDEAEHKHFCGVSNIMIRENITRLVHDTTRKNITLLPRIPLIPGITDTDNNITAVAHFLKECAVAKVDLLPYNPLWHGKSWSLGKQVSCHPVNELTGFMSQERVDHCKAIVRSAGINT